MLESIRRAPLFKYFADMGDDLGKAGMQVLPRHHTRYVSGQQLPDHLQHILFRVGVNDVALQALGWTLRGKADERGHSYAHRHLLLLADNKEMTATFPREGDSSWLFQYYRVPQPGLHPITGRRPLRLI